MIYLGRRGTERLILRMISVCFTMPQPRGHVCMHICWFVDYCSFNTACSLFFHPTQAPPLLYIHLSPIHHFTCLSNLPFIFSPAFNPLHSHHFLLLCADLSKIFYVTHTTLLHSLSKSSLRFCRRYIKSQRRTSSTAIFKPLHYSHEGSAQACGS